MAPPYTLRTLGAPFLLAASGEVVRFRTRKHFALLIRLAVEPAKPLTRDYLIELLWGTAPEAAGRHSLAQAVTVLRAKIGRQHILIHKSTIAVAADVVRADVTHLDECDGEIRGRFLDAFTVPGARGFEDWRDAWHARLLPRLRDCLVRHMDGARRIGDFATVQKHAEVLADLDPLSEDALRGIMEARAWVGDRSNALKAYAAFETRLAQELGARPAPELARIAHLLREGRRSPYRQPSEPPPEAGEKRFEPERVVGREREFSRLYDAWLGARGGEPCVMVLTGDPGVGKTTLTNAFVSTCQLEGAVVARAQAYDAERELPFAVLAELVRQLTIQRAIGCAEPEALSELSRICADVVAAFPGVPKPVEWSAEVTPLRLADAFLKTIVAAAEESPLVLVVDDIHAADNASAAILHVVARKLQLVRVVLILAGRTSEIRASGAPQALATDSAIATLRSIELEPLDDQAGARFITLLSEAGECELPNGVAGRILLASGGSPLAIELLVHEWQAHGAASLLTDLDRLNTLPVPTLGIPPAIHRVFDRRVALLDTQSRSVLTLAAVLGRRLSELALYEVLELSAADAAMALARLRDEGFLREVHSELEFRNELLRAQAYYAATAVTRQHLHNAVAKTLLTQQPDSEATLLQIAWHFLRGSNLQKGLEFGLRGARCALQSGAPQEAEEILVSIARAAPQFAENSELNMILARALLAQSKAEQASPVLDSLRARGDLSAKQAAEMMAMRASAVYLAGTEGLDDTYRRASDEALAAARASQDRGLLDGALFEYARSGVESGDETRVAETRSELKRRASEADRNQGSIVLIALAYCEYYSHDMAVAAQTLDVATKALTTAQDPVPLSLALNGLGAAREHVCDLAGAKQAFEDSLRVAESLGDDSRVSIVCSNLCVTSMYQGDVEGAIRWGERSVAVGRSASQPQLCAAFMNLTGAYMLASNRTKALDSADAAASWRSRSRSWRANVVYLLDAASTELVFGNPARAIQLMTKCDEVVGDRYVADSGSYWRLKAWWSAHMRSDAAAAEIITEAERRFATRDPLLHLDALAARAWLERRTRGSVSATVLEEGEAIRRRVPGKARLLALQGFPIGTDS